MKNFLPRIQRGVRAWPGPSSFAGLRSVSMLLRTLEQDHRVVLQAERVSVNPRSVLDAETTTHGYRPSYPVNVVRSIPIQGNGYPLSEDESATARGTTRELGPTPSGHNRWILASSS